jgi:signal transduction histidine kinase
MRRRITAAIVGVTAIVLLVLGIPLAIAVQTTVLQSEVVELQGEAVRLLSETSVPLDRAELGELTPRDADVTATVYDAAGQRVVGPGPAVGDEVVRRALAGIATTDRSGRLIVATPITARTDDEIVGALVLVESRGESTGRIARVWVVMAGAALVALGLAWLLARAMARRLSRPVQHLAAMAADIGEGRVVDAPAPSSIAELDALGATLAASSRDVHEVVARERRFSADVSHQLRTPLTHLRLTLERACDEAAGDGSMINASLHDVTRIEATVDHLLAFAREAVPSGGTTDLVRIATEAADRWAAAAAAAGRAVQSSHEQLTVPVRASSAAVDQTLDVLIDNALRYGDGPVRVTTRVIAGGAAIDVTDDGSATLDDTVFERGTGNGHGIGLALARSIVEAEGGRLLLTRRSPPTFSVVLLAEA